jgi:TonB family protein
VGLLEEGARAGEATRGEDIAHRMLPDETGLPLQSLRGPLAPEGLSGKRRTLEGGPQAPAAAPPTGREETPSRSWRPYVREMAAGAETGQEVDWYSVEGPLQYRPILASPAPKYPAGVQVERRVRVHVRVSPSGGVIDAFAVERGHAALDSAAVASLYRWRFAPLPDNVDQVNQEGDVTLLFRLKAPGVM